MKQIQLRTKKRDDNYQKLILVFQTLYGEEIIKKLTYDKMYSLLTEMEKEQPDVHDFLADLKDQCHQVPLPAVQRTTSTPEHYYTTEVVIAGSKYNLTLKPQ